MKLGPPATDYKRAASHRGAYLIRQTRWGLIAQKWPRKRGKPKKASDVIKQALFAYAAHWAVNPEPIAYQTAIYLTKGTLMMPRDMLIAATYGNALTFIDENGNELKRYYDVAADPQATLDLITDIPGSMLVRLPEGWVGLLIGNERQVLTIIDGLPDWADGGSGGSGASYLTLFPTPANDGIAAATKAQIFTFTSDVSISDIAVPLNSQAIGASVDVSIWRTTGKVLDERVAGPFTLFIDNKQRSFFKHLDTAIEVTAGSQIAVLVTLTTGTATTSCPLLKDTHQPYGAPLDTPNCTFAYLATLNPTVGNTLSTGQSGIISYVATLYLK